MTTYALILINYLMLACFSYDEPHTKYVSNENFKEGLRSITS
ncbi:hypothetical protein VCRA2119O430_260040 [Vibrio crassostreae]|nr:hypothetical protein VCRA2118O429_230045 [Vibrio crassostreae]CAK1924076.1 hypothetical protein VCRA2117O428_240040 [Vibrio crassostreae]CAK1940033.1 hypothetical protein VCRA2119O430_260040 [Vibrio crassostreae]CAK1941792.1 hypothetical protein VCRA2114O422_270041 [Vibrio crassostreae]CAK1947794.1 hypothetical protein VCRA2119O431_270040 [Vibrio crassostreae]